MANPILPIAQGSNLPSLDKNEDVNEAIMQEDEIEHYEDVLGLEEGEGEEEREHATERDVLEHVEPAHFVVEAVEKFVQHRRRTLKIRVITGTYHPYRDSSSHSSPDYYRFSETL